MADAFKAGPLQRFSAIWNQAIDSIHEVLGRVDESVRIKLLQMGSEFSPQKFIKEVALPLLAAGFGFGIAIRFVIFPLFPEFDSGWMSWLPILLPAICTFLIFFYPKSLIDARRQDMDSKIHLFITYIGTLQTSKPTRKVLFYMAAQKEEYGELAAEARNILRLADAWGIGYAKACRITSKTVPSDIFGDFLERMAHSFQSGEDTQVFLDKEQKVVMAGYESMYKGALYSVDGMKDMYTSLTTTLSFMTTMALLLPFITGQSITTLMGLVVVAFLFVDGMTLWMVKGMLPHDFLLHDLSVKSNGELFLEKYLPILFFFSLLVFCMALILNQFRMPWIVAIGTLPIGVYGYLAGIQETKVRRADDNFSAFIRTLGGAAGARSGLVASVLGSMRIHDYGPLTKSIRVIYRRLGLGDSKKAWTLFAGEIGSDLILKFSLIFQEGVYIGGHAGKISQLISDNFEKVHSLRRERQLTANAMRGTLYGGGIGMALAIYVTMVILEFLIANIGDFSGIEAILPGVGTMSGANMEFINLLVWMLLVLHSGISAVILKVTDGGDMNNALFHFMIMIWISAFIATQLPPLFSGLFGIDLS